MCGIAGILSIDEKLPDRIILEGIEGMIDVMRSRGPDHQHSLIKNNVALGHARLSIIDVSTQSNQPFLSEDKRYAIVYNGELFNYKSLRFQLEKAGISFRTKGDVEVLLKLYIEYGPECLNLLSGFFAFAIYDFEQAKLFLARDRFGVKPCYFSLKENYFYFSSSLKAVMNASNQRKIDYKSLQNYFMLNYIPGYNSIISGINRLLPGQYLSIENGQVEQKAYYIPEASINKDPSHALKDLLYSAVEERLESDVPVGSFLSGGIDSSIISAIAQQKLGNLSTFSLGFKDNSFFDESQYASIMAKSLGTKHHTFMIGNDEMLNELDPFLAALDEPFADSSALNVFILSKRTKQHVKVVLSGDGADEVFAGYNKHRAEWIVRNEKFKKEIFKAMGSFAPLFPASRSSKLGNKVRQLKKFYELSKLNSKERYWYLASISKEAEVNELLNGKFIFNYYSEWVSGITDDFNTFLKADQDLVLTYDMLTKVDMMSMANGLEVRSPFMNHKLIAYINSLPSHLKISKEGQKLVLKKTFSELLPQELLHRKKHGFEIPLLGWLRNELSGKLNSYWLSDKILDDMPFLNKSYIRSLHQKINSNSPEDSVAKLWAIVLFVDWFKRNNAHA